MSTKAERQARNDKIKKVAAKMADAVTKSIEDKTIEKLLCGHIEELDPVDQEAEKIPSWIGSKPCSG